MATTTINWFPGHMRKTQREIKENLKLVEAIIEIRDARIPRSSANPDIEKLCGNKPRLILLNKSDLTENCVTREWMKELSKENVKAIEVNCLKGKGLNQIKPALEELLKEKLERYKAKGLVNVVIRVMVVGIPNVGKSTLINKLAGRKVTSTGNKPGVTKQVNWLKTSNGFLLLDTPGILWPKIEDNTEALSLASTATIKMEVLNMTDIGGYLITFFKNYYKDILENKYKIEISNDPSEIFTAIAKKFNFFEKDGEIDYEKVSNKVYNDLVSGSLKGVTFDRWKK